MTYIVVNIIIREHGRFYAKDTKDKVLIKEEWIFCMDRKIP